VHRIFLSSGVAEFHTPAEHYLQPNVDLDVELEFLLEDVYGNMARISVFFDRAVGGRQANPFIEMLNLENPGRDQINNLTLNA